MRYAIACVAVAVAIVACYGGNTNYTSQTPPTHGGVGNGPPVFTDGGTDGGTDAGNNGTDAGCVETLILSWNATDNCNAGGANTGASVSIDSNTCTANIQFGTGSSPCEGTVSGLHDAFNGSCLGTNNDCTSSSIPGTITCTGAAPACTIVVCPNDGGC